MAKKGQKTKQLSGYQIHWLILIPESGIPTKRDLEVINRKTKSLFHKGSKEILGHFVSKKKALESLAKIKGLYKSYKAYIITDKQMGKTKIDWSTGETKFLITNKQQKAVKTVK